MITSEKLKRLCNTEMISLRGICNKAGLKYNTIYVKINRGFKMSPEQGQAIDSALQELREEL